MQTSLEQDLAAIAKIEAVPTILRTIREWTGLRFTLIARVLPDRWIACAVHDEINFGLAVGGELDVNTTLCREVRDSLQPVIIDHASEDATYACHDTPKLYGFESYISIPIIRTNGQYFGNVCGLDPLPRPLKNEKTLAMLTMFSNLISLQLDAEDRHEANRAELTRQREIGELRDQFIAVLGHDVRNPLSSIAMGTDLLLRSRPEASQRRILERIRSSTRRIETLVEDLLDLARGEVGEGLTLHVTDVVDLEARLLHVVAEIQATHPSRPVAFEMTVTGPVWCDEQRIEQLLSNLLANAMEHGTARTSVDVKVSGTEDALEICVSNEGDTISESAMARLFQPYFRGGQSGRRNGLGLGLYIVSAIAKVHGGSVNVTSVAGRTTFKFTMPRRRPGAQVDEAVTS